MPETVPTSTAIKIKTIHYDACGTADDRESLNNEYMVVENTNSVSVNMKGWILKDEANHRFEFPQFILKPGKTVTVHTGKDSDTQLTSTGIAAQLCGTTTTTQLISTILQAD